MAIGRLSQMPQDRLRALSGYLDKGRPRVNAGKPFTRGSGAILAACPGGNFRMGERFDA